MISMPKRVEHEAWEKRKHGRRTNGERGAVILAFPERAEVKAEFKIEIRRHDATDSFALTLEGRLIGRPFEGLLRYNVHDSIHRNPDWFPPPIVESGTLHRHVYREQAVREGRDWDACAEVLNVDPKGSLSPNQQIERLIGAFLVDASIRVSDSHTHGQLFGTDI